jgi:hypothetical protein
MRLRGFHLRRLKKMKSPKKRMVPVERNIYEFRGFVNYNGAQDNRADAGEVLRPSWLKDKNIKKEKK